MPTFQIASADAPSTRRLIASLNPDIIGVACYRSRIPPRTFGLARLAALNVHPSRLPEGRGPDPLFWTLHRGDGQAAVTVHGLDSRFDTGPIYAQRRIIYADGTSEAELEVMLAEAGGRLLGETIATIAVGASNALPQDETLATYQTWPSDSDYSIDTTRTARTAFNFIRGVSGRGRSVIIQTADERVTVAEAIAHSTDYQPAPHDPLTRWIQFRAGWLLIREPAPGELP